MIAALFLLLLVLAAAAGMAANTSEATNARAMTAATPSAD